MSAMRVLAMGTLLWVAGWSAPAWAQPVADAGPDQAVFVGATVTLNGSGSTPAGVAFAWTFASRAKGSAATLSGATTATPTFVVDKAGTYVVRLVVSAGGVSSTTDTVSITTVNRAPVAHAGPPAAVGVGKKATPDGSASSDPDGDKLTYAWTLLSKPAAARGTLDKADRSKASIVLDRPGTYVAQLTVSDGVLSASDTVTLTTVNGPPVAHAGPDVVTGVGQAAVLDGSGTSDRDEQALTYAWTVKTRAKGSVAEIVGADTVRPAFTPDVAGNYTLLLTVSDGLLSDTDTMVLTTANVKPVAAAGPDQPPVAVGVPVRLDGSAASDANGQALAFTWILKGPTGSTATLSDATDVRPTFTPDLPGGYTAKLTVSDGTASGTDTVKFQTKNVPPVAAAGPDQLVAVGATVTLDGSASSDLDGQRLTYGWAWSSRPAGSGAAFSNVAAIKPTFVADVAGTYVAQLIVFDGVGLSAADTVAVATEGVAPVARAGHDRAATVGATVGLDGSGSVDPAGGALAYAWTLVSRPATSTAALTGSTTPTPAFVADKAGDYVVQLTVTDGTGRPSAPDTVLVSTGNLAPRAQAGADQLVAVGATVTLSGAGTVDPNGGTPSHAWALVAWPAESAAALSSTTTVGTSFVADVTGEYVAQLIARDASLAGPPDTVYIRAEAGSPGEFGVSPLALSFGTQQVGTTGAAQTVTLANGTAGPVTISGITASGDFAVTSSCPASLAAGAECTALVTFSPTATGSRVGAVSVASSATAVPIEVTLSGTGTAAALSVAPASLSFGSQVVTTTSTAQAVTVTNTGIGPVTIASITASGDFTRTTSCGASLSPGSACTVNVTFTPTVTGSRTGALTITSSAPGSPHIVTLQGTGAASTITVLPATLTFPVRQIGVGAPPQTVTITNTGPASVSLGAINVSGDFARTSSCPATLASGGSCTVQVTFTPTAAGVRSGSLVVNSDAQGNPHSVVLEGTGTTDAVALLPGALVFGAQLQGTQSVAQVLAVTNVGAAPITFSNAFMGSGAFDFAVTSGTCAAGATIAPGQACQLNVRFTPPLTYFVGARTGSVTVNTSAKTLSAALSGTATGMPALGAPASVAFGPQVQGTTSAAQVVTLTNTGDVRLQFSSVFSTTANYTITAQTCQFAQLEPGASCTVTLAFTPQVTFVTGARPGTLRIVSNTGSTAGSVNVNTDVPLSGTATGAPVVSPAPTALSFGPQLQGTTSATQVVTVTNTGDVRLQFSSVFSTTAQYTITAQTCQFAQLEPGASCTVTLAFAPQVTFVTGARPGILRIVSNTGSTAGSVNVNTDVPLSGTATGAPVLSAPASIAFGPQLQGTTSATQVVTLTNTGDVRLDFSSVFSLTGNYTVTAQTCQFAQLAPGASCTVTLAFTPQVTFVTGARTGTLRIASNSGSTAGSASVNLDLPLSGTATGAPALGAPASVAFGPQLQGTTSATQVVTLTNTGDVRLDFSSVFSTTSDYTVTAQTCQFVQLAPGASCTVTLAFTPQVNFVTGPRPGSLRIVSNTGSTAGSVNVNTDLPLSGTATGAPALSAPASTAFGDVPLGATSGQTVTLTNTGDVRLTFSSVFIASGQFAIVSNGCQFQQVAPGASCVVQVQFAPTGSSGARTGTLRISSNTGSTTGSVFVNTDVTLEGTATAPVPTP